MAKLIVNQWKKNFAHRVFCVISFRAVLEKNCLPTLYFRSINFLNYVIMAQIFFSKQSMELKNPSGELIAKLKSYRELIVLFPFSSLLKLNLYGTWWWLLQSKFSFFYLKRCFFSINVHNKLKISVTQIQIFWGVNCLTMWVSLRGILWIT